MKRRTEKMQKTEGIVSEWNSNIADDHKRHDSLGHGGEFNDKARDPISKAEDRKKQIKVFHNAAQALLFNTPTGPIPPFL